ncbi:T9SS type B sorting domain-containing protein [Winogradskyella sp. A3E31]|uniref:T9SS type B sorting domain-containing protein n=1 Tax=Winogradskyella sp. A3E31 TaxID=3349637 RepID=UPI00398B141A
MKTTQSIKHYFILCVILTFGTIKNSYAQLGFCSGNSGDTIFTENFGTGTTNNPLPAGTTNYNYSNGYPDDGFYTVTNGTFGNPFDWHETTDHTPGDTNGKCLIVNAGFTAGEFYRTTITGLCETTTYEFSAWLLNVLKIPGFCSQQSTEIPVNVKFEIWDGTDSNLLASGDTGDIFGTTTPQWEEYGLVFQTLAGQSTVILKMINNGQGGCGNDLAIDDIEFKSCGDVITITDSNNNDSSEICSVDAPYNTTLTVTPDFSVYSSHFYQWQQSTDGINWIDISGETNQTLSVSVSTTTIFRAKVAEVQVNLNNPQCVSFSNEYEVIVNQLPQEPVGECWETVTLNTMTCSWDVTGTQPQEPTTLCWEIATFNDTTCTWEVTGTQPQEPATECWETTAFNTTTCMWEVTGTQPQQPSTECWEATNFNTTTCAWEVTGTQPQEPSTECWETAIFNSTSCLWEVTGNQPQEPATECWETSNFNLTTCSWEVTGTQPQEPATECWETATFNSTLCQWEVMGSQPPAPNLECWQTTEFNNDTCQWDIFGEQPGSIETFDVILCKDTTITLTAITTIDMPSFDWSTGDMSQSIDVDSQGVYTVDISGENCAFETLIFNVTLVEPPVIQSIETQNQNIIVTLQNEGNYLFSLDNINFQRDNTFPLVEGGLYTIYVINEDCNYLTSAQHLHFYIPKYFTPNGDGNHDTFSLSGIEFFGESEVAIFDRYGKLLANAKNRSFFWDGRYNNQLMPTADYWYKITIDGDTFTGHFTLKR